MRSCRRRGGGSAHLVEAIDFHLVDDAEEFAEPALREAILAGEPSEVFDGQIVERDAARRKMRGAELAERHPRGGDVGEIGGHPSAQPFVCILFLLLGFMG